MNILHTEWWSIAIAPEWWTEREEDAVVIGDRASGRVRIGHQRVVGVQVDRKRLGQFQHRIVERGHGELLCLARGAGKAQVGHHVVVIFRAHQGRRPARGRGCERAPGQITDGGHLLWRRFSDFRTIRDDRPAG